MRLINILLLASLILIQSPLWYGRGGWFNNQELEGQLKLAQQNNQKSKQRNEKLRSEVEDLDSGTETLEERARLEMSLVKKDEMFIQILDKPLPVAVPKDPAVLTSTKNVPEDIETPVEKD